MIESRCWIDIPTEITMGALHGDIRAQTVLSKRKQLVLIVSPLDGIKKIRIVFDQSIFNIEFDPPIRTNIFVYIFSGMDT